jgi:transcriptional regulator with XRE-family HTH domain
MKFAENLSKIMEEKHLTQMALAELIGLRQSQVSNWLHGKSEPCMYAIMKLGEKLNVSTDELLGMDSLS